MRTRRCAPGGDYQRARASAGAGAHAAGSGLFAAFPWTEAAATAAGDASLTSTPASCPARAISARRRESLFGGPLAAAAAAAAEAAPGVDAPPATPTRQLCSLAAASPSPVRPSPGGDAANGGGGLRFSSAQSADACRASVAPPGRKNQPDFFHCAGGGGGEERTGGGEGACGCGCPARKCASSRRRRRPRRPLPACGSADAARAAGQHAPPPDFLLSRLEVGQIVYLMSGAPRVKRNSRKQQQTHDSYTSHACTSRKF